MIEKNVRIRDIDTESDDFDRYLISLKSDS